MNVGIITRRDGYNFGTSLQAFALYHIIQKLGCNATVIDYSEYSLKARCRYFILNILGICNIPCNKYNIRYKQRLKFQEFDKILEKTNIKFKNKIPLGWNDGFKKVVCGSDQIWNPEQKTDAFLLNFVPDTVDRIAYAPSIGLSNCKNKFSDNDIMLLKKFKYISCREIDGCQILSSITGMKCPTVVDPTILLEKSDWENLEHKYNIPQPYLLTYFLGSLNNYPIKIIRELAAKHNLRIINVCLPHYDDYPAVQNIRCNPSEFLYLIHHSSIVCTNSYHGSIFSMIYNKLFYVFDRGYRKHQYNEQSRFETLFDSTSITTCSIDIDSIKELPYDYIDYEVINNIIRRKKELSKQYLEETLYE